MLKTATEAEFTQTKHLTLKDEPEMIPNDTGSMKRPASMSVLPDHTSLENDGAPPGLDKRRVSWAFEHPEIPSCSDPSLNDMKALLKKQIRSKVPTPDFIYLTVSALKNQVMSTYPYEHSKNSEFPKPSKPSSVKDTLARRPILKNRPQSSPSSIDTKTKMRISDTMAELLQEHAIEEDGRSVKSGKTSGGGTTHSGRSADNRDKAGAKSAQRAQSAHVFRVQSAGTARCQSANSWRAKAVKKLNGKSYHGLTTTATETNIVPMLMYPKDGLKAKINTANLKKWPSQETIAKNHPLCSGNDLRLRTYTEEAKRIANMQSCENVNNNTTKSIIKT